MENKNFISKISAKGEEYFVNTERFTITRWNFETEKEEDVIFVDDTVIDQALKIFNDGNSNDLIRIDNKYYEILGNRNSDFMLKRQAYFKFEIIDELSFVYALKSNINEFLDRYPELEETILSLAKDFAGYYVFVYDPTTLSPYVYINNVIEELEKKKEDYNILREFENLFHHEYIPLEVGILGN